MTLARRTFLHMASALPLGAAAGTAGAQTRSHLAPSDPIPVSLCLNAYSFNRMLRSGQMTLEELFRFAKRTGFQGVDLTAYYIPGYPEVPGDEVLYGIKRMAFRLGLTLTGTGVRNSFTMADPQQRSEQRQLVKDWVVAAAKMGAPHVRLFDGKDHPAGHSRAQITDWLVESFQECAAFGEQYGVMIAYQNHNEFAVNATQVKEIIERVDSDWLGLMLDIGSLPDGPGEDVYQQIEALIPYAATWQVKELVQAQGKKVKTDFPRLMQLVRRSGYRGYFPLETLGAGDPYVKVEALFREVSGLL